MQRARVCSSRTLPSRRGSTGWRVRLAGFSAQRESNTSGNDKSKVQQVGCGARVYRMRATKLPFRFGQPRVGREASRHSLTSAKGNKNENTKIFDHSGPDVRSLVGTGARLFE